MNYYNPDLASLDQQLTYAIRAAYDDDLYESLLSEDSQHFGMLQSGAVPGTGDRIDVNLIVEDPVGDWYNDTDRFSYRKKDPIAKGTLNWKKFYTGNSLTEDELNAFGTNFVQLRNARGLSDLNSRHALVLIDKIAAETKAMNKYIIKRQAAGVLGDGEGRGGRLITGLQAITRKGAAYAGIDPDAYGETDIESVLTGQREGKWDPHQLDLDDAPVDQDHLAQICSAIHRSSMMVDIRGVCPVTIFNYLNLQLEPDKMRNNSAVRLGFGRHIYYDEHRLTIFPESFMTGSDLGKTMFFYMPSRVYYLVHKALNMLFSGVMMTYDQPMGAYRVQHKSQMRCDDRTRTGSFINAGGGNYS